MKYLSKFLSTLDLYILRRFFSNFFLCLFSAISLFLVIDLFERSRIFLREESSLTQVASYMLFKVPFIAQMMTPIAALLATLIAVGSLSQLSEITAMRACGISVMRISLPILSVAMLISLISLIAGETIVPWSTNKFEEIYELDIKKKNEKGDLNQTNFWYRKDNNFYRVDLYNSRDHSLNGVSIFTLDKEFSPESRLDSARVDWQRPEAGWLMNEVVESQLQKNGDITTTQYETIPLVIDEKPADFYSLRKKPEALSFFELKRYIEKLKSEGVPTTKYIVDLASKLSFPFVSFIVCLVAIPFSLTSARSGTMTASFVGGVSIGFSYHILHAICTALGAGELIPVVPSAIAANVILGCIGGYLLAGSD